MFKVYSQILEDSYMKQMYDSMLGVDFPWFFYWGNATEGDGNFMFAHIFFIRNEINSSFYFLLEPILKFIKEKKNYKKIYRIKANLYTNKDKPSNQPSHYDYIKDELSPIAIETQYDIKELDAVIISAISKKNNQKINDVLDMDFTNFSRRNKKCKCGKKK